MSLDFCKQKGKWHLMPAKDREGSQIKGQGIAQEMKYLIRGRGERYVKCFPN